MNDEKIIESISTKEDLDKSIRFKAIEIALFMEGREVLSEKFIVSVALQKAQQWFINLNG